MGAPGKYTLNINKGATLDFNFNYAIGGVSANLSGYSVRLQAREYEDGPVLIDFNNALTANGFIYLTGTVGDREDGANGNVRIYMTASNTSLVPSLDTMKYDLEIESASGEVDRLIEGPVVVRSNYSGS